MKIINLGILAHVDAGKTTLTESLLYTSGAIAELGSVDEGTTWTDTMNLERQRGITIQTAVTSFQWEDVKVNINMGFRYGTYVWDPNYKGLDDYIWECCFQRKRSQ